MVLSVLSPLASIRTLIVAAAALSAACWVEPDGAPPTARPATTASVSPSPSTSSPPPTPTPILVSVDTGRTLNAAPGDGVGIFVEYATGGQWHVWWTCDTSKTGASCGFDLTIKSETGDITSITSEGVLASDSVVSTDPRTIKARSNTGSNAVGVTFAAPAGGVVSIDAAVGGVRDASFFFFVQDGKPNGGYTGSLTDPLKFRGATP